MSSTMERPIGVASLCIYFSMMISGLLSSDLPLQKDRSAAVILTGIVPCRDEARPFPDVGYSLMGYNVVKGYPLARGRDPGFTRPIFEADYSQKRTTGDCRYLLPTGITAASDVSCHTSFSSTVIESASDLQTALSARANVEGGGWGASFSASAEYNQASSTVSTGKTKIIQSSASCRYYYTKYQSLEFPKFSTELIGHLRRMNEAINNTGVLSDSYVNNFYDHFGTHFPVTIEYGARFTYQHKLSASSFESLKSSSLSIEVQASYSGLFSLGGGVGMDKSQVETAKRFSENAQTSTISEGATPPADGDAMAWASEVKNSALPVKYKLKPIYEIIFDNNNPHLHTYIEEKNAILARDALKNIGTRYIKHLAKLGANFAAVDNSVLRFNDLVVANYNEADQYNVGIDRCIEKCLNRKDCAILSLYPSDVRTNRCILDDDDEPYRNMSNEQGGITMIAISDLTREMAFSNLTFDQTVRRENKIEIKGSDDYQVIKQFCLTACVDNSRCTGFEVTNNAAYRYNCATYSEYSESMVYTPTREFETHILPSKAKESLKDSLYSVAAAKQFDNTDLVASSNQEIKKQCDYACCRDHCETITDCIAFVEDKDDNCRIIKGLSLGLTPSSKASSFQVVGVFTERSNGGWFNITGFAAINKDVPHKWAANSVTSCAEQCSIDVTCQVASWDGTKCNNYDRDAYSYAEPVSGPNSVLMFPTSALKYNNFKSQV